MITARWWEQKRHSFSTLYSSVMSAVHNKRELISVEKLGGAHSSILTLTDTSFQTIMYSALYRYLIVNRIYFMVFNFHC